MAEGRGWSWTTWDWALPAVIAGLVVVEVLLYRPENWPAALAMLGASCAFLVTRRRWPLASCVPAGVLCLAIPWAGPELDDLASPIFVLVLIAWSLARWLPGHLLGLTALIGVALLLFSDYLFTDERVNGITDVLFAASLLVPPYVFGKVSRRLDEQGRLLVAQQEQIRDQAVRDERDRIARELHDVLAHSVSAMVVQTAAAQDLLRSRPDRAAELLTSVAEAGRAALTESGRLLHLLRDESDELGLRPVPGLADLPSLVATCRLSGMEVEALIDPPERPLPAGADVSAYRVVQEALTNALKHGAGPVRLSVTAGRDGLRIRCVNRVAGGGRLDSGLGSGLPSGLGWGLDSGLGSGLGSGLSTGLDSGLGLQGMAERIELLGGSLHHGRVGECFEVEAVIPLAEATA